MIRIRTPLTAVFIALLSAQPLLADDRREDDQAPDWARDWAPEFESLGGSEYGIIPLHRAVPLFRRIAGGALVALGLWLWLRSIGFL